MTLNEQKMTGAVEQRTLPFWGYLAALLAYVAAFRLSLFAWQGGQMVAAIWPASGLAIWLVARFDRRMLFVLALGEWLATWWLLAPATKPQILVMLTTVAAGNLLTAFVGAWLLNHGLVRWRNSLGSFLNPASYLVTALLAPLVSATTSVSALILLGGRPAATALNLWSHWWVNDLIGILYVLPLLMAVPELWPRLQGARRPALLRGAFLLTALAGSTLLAFGLRNTGGFLFALFPLLVLATIWFGTPGASLAAFLIAVVGIVAATCGRGPFITGNLLADLFNVQLFLAAVALVALFLPGLHSRLNLNRRTPLVVLLGGWALSGLLFYLIQREQVQRAERDFVRQTDSAQREMEAHLESYSDGLVSAAGLVLTSQSVERQEWKTFAETLNLPSRNPGIASLGLIFRVPPSETGAFLKRVRADGAPDFKIHTLSDETPAVGQDQYIITYLEPETRFHAVLGLDIATEKERRRTADAARDSGELRVTPRIALTLGTNGLVGAYMLYLPVYRKGVPLTTVAERRAAIQAWVYAPFIPALYRPVALGQRADELSLHFFDAGPLDKAHLVFATGQATESIPSFARVTALTIAGTTFNLGWNRGPTAVGTGSPLIWLAVTCALGTVLLAGWVLSLQFFRERAETLVIERTAALRESDQRFHMANRAVFNVIWDQNLPAGDIWWNENLQVVYGYPPEAIANGDMWRNCIHSQDLERVLTGVNAAVDSGAELWADSYRFRRADGTYAFVDDRALIVRDKSGRPVRMIGAMQDITARKQAEESLRQQQQELQLILDSVPALIFYKDRQHLLIRVNQEAVRVTGLTREQIEGKSDREMGRELAADYYRDEDEVMATGIAKCGIIEQLETPFGLRWMQTDKLPYRNAQGEIVGVIGFAVDITQRLQAEREREQLEAQLRQVQKMEAIGNLSGGIAHDFNNILGAILGNAELARQDVGVGHPALESINDLIKAGTRAKNLVSQILTFAREQPRDRHITALPPLIEENLHLLQVTLPANVTLVKSIAKDLPNVLADATQIQQLMLNLGTNAGHALQGEAGMITVTLTAVTVDESLKHQHQDLRLGRYVALSVADTGIGMDAKLLGRIFDPFFTTKPPGQGTGLGLSVVHGIMKTLNGVITVQSQPGKGTTFTLFFPTVDEPADTIPQPPTAPISGHGQRILYLDDDVQVVTVTAHTLERLGYHVTSHTSPPEALTDFRTNPQQFDLVITDYNMPEMTGLDVAAELLRIRPALPVIISSGYLTEELTMKAHAIGVQGVISKPTSVDEFSHLIYQSIQKSKIS